MVSYLITGGAGFIGYSLAKALDKKGASITILDTPEKIRKTTIDKKFTVIAGDIAKRDTFDDLPKGRTFDAVLHLAAQTSARISQEMPEMDIDTNGRGTMLLVDWCLKNGIDRILYSSSMAVYGDPEVLPVTEKTSLAPVSHYGVSKLTGEYYIKAASKLGLKHTIFRLFNVYGPGQDMSNLKQGMISIYLAYVMNGQTIPVTGSLDRFRDFIYIDDVVNAWVIALHDEKFYNRTYNLGTGVKTTVREAIDMIISAYGYDEKTYPVKEVEGHTGDQFGLVSDSTIFASESGWKPEVSVSEGVSRMVKWVKPVR